MKFVDTNILIHLLTDEPKRAVRLIDSLFETAAPGEIVILDAVLAETCTVLEFNPRFGLSRSLISSGLSDIFSRQSISMSAIASGAFELYTVHRKLDIVDCLLATAAQAKADQVGTFDKDLQKSLK